MRRRLPYLLILGLGVTLAACEQEGAAPVSEEPTAEMAAPAAQTYTVQVDGRADYNSSFLAFFPRETKVHAGDTVAFRWVDTGEPHTVTFGSLVDAAVAALEGADMEGPPPPEWEKLPVLIDEESLAVAQSAAQPCFLMTGEPGTEACDAADQEQADFDGSATFYNSGWPEGAGTFTVKLDPATAPGRYNFVCLLHVPFMAGVIEVVDAADEADAPADATARGESELADMAAALTETVGAAEAPDAATVLAGILPDAEIPASGDLFRPNEITIEAGDAVTWQIAGPHLVAFNSPSEAVGVRYEGPDGAISLNMASIGPSGGSPGMPAPPEDAESEGTDDATAAPEESPAAEEMPPPTVVDGGEWDGTGFYNSGLFLSFPPNMFAFKLTFTEPGSYPYLCLLHPGMSGVVLVK
jgi:plastocyanin